MANGAVYSDDESVMEIHDRKLDALEDIIESMNGRPLLVAYWFKHDWSVSENALKSVKSSLAEIFPNGTAEKSLWRLYTPLLRDTV